MFSNAFRWYLTVLLEDKADGLIGIQLGYQLGHPRLVDCWVFLNKFHLRLVYNLFYLEILL